MNLCRYALFACLVTYDDVNMNTQMLAILKSEDFVVANLIVDHFEDHLPIYSYALQVLQYCYT